MSPTSTGTETLRPTVLSAIRRHGLLVTAVLIVCTVLGGLVGAAITSKAEATASIVVQDPATTSLATAVGGTGAQADPNYVQDQVAILQLPSLAATAAQRWNDRSGAVRDSRPLSTTNLLDNLSVKNSTGTDLIKISYTSADPATAAGVANMVVQTYSNYVQTRSAAESASQIAAIKKALAVLARQKVKKDQATQDQRTALLTAQAHALLQTADTSTGIQASSKALVPASPSKTGWLRFGLVGLLVGLIPAAGIAYATAVRRRRFRDRFEPELILRRPLITEVPSFDSEGIKTSLPAAERPASAAAEAFRFASSSLAIRESTRGARTFGVVSASSGDGKTTVAANLALTAAQNGLRVLAIDADFHGRALTGQLMRSGHSIPGLLQVLEGTASLSDAVRSVNFGPGTSLALLPGGLYDRLNGDALNRAALSALFAELSTRYDLVIVDTAPILQVAYTSTVLKHVDQVLAVVPHRSSVARLEELDERMNFLDVEVAGYIYDKAPLRPGLGQHSVYLPNQTPGVKASPRGRERDEEEAWDVTRLLDG